MNANAAQVKVDLSPVPCKRRHLPSQDVALHSRRKTCLTPDSGLRNVFARDDCKAMIAASKSVAAHSLHVVDLAED